MFVVHFFDQSTYEFRMSLHSTRAAAEAVYENLLRQYVVKNGDQLPPKSEWEFLIDDMRETVRLYAIECDGTPAQLIPFAATAAAEATP